VAFSPCSSCTCHSTKNLATFTHITTTDSNST
jgi:hypothetical protein